MTDRRMSCKNCGYIWRVPAGMPGTDAKPFECSMCELPVCACGCGADLSDLRSGAMWIDRAHAETLRRAGEGEPVAAKAHVSHIEFGDGVDDAKKRWTQLVRYSILAAAVNHSENEVHADDIRDLGVPEKLRRSIVGKQFALLASQGFINHTGYRPSTVKSRHGGLNRIFTLTVAGAREFASMPEPEEITAALRLVPDSVGAEAPKSPIRHPEAA